MTDKDLAEDIRMHVEEINSLLKEAYSKGIEIGFIFTNKAGVIDQRAYLEPGDTISIEASKHEIL